MLAMSKHAASDARDSMNAAGRTVIILTLHLMGITRREETGGAINRSVATNVAFFSNNETVCALNT